MIETVELVHEEGSHREHAVVMYALSTCGFCKKALEFLKSRSVDFQYVYVDALPMDTKTALKEELRKRYRIKELFPTLVLDGTDAITGFDREEWERRLGLG